MEKRQLGSSELVVDPVGLGCMGFSHASGDPILNYLLLRNHFVFFDFDAPRIVFYLDYIAIMGLFICIGHYLARWLRSFPTRNNE